MIIENKVLKFRYFFFCFWLVQLRLILIKTAEKKLKFIFDTFFQQSAHLLESLSYFGIHLKEPPQFGTILGNRHLGLDNVFLMVYS